MILRYNGCISKKQIARGDTGDRSEPMKQPGFMIYAEDWACYTEDYSDEELGEMIDDILKDVPEEKKKKRDLIPKTIIRR